METVYVVKISHLVEIFHEIVIVMTSYANCNRARQFFKARLMVRKYSEI